MHDPQAQTLSTHIHSNTGTSTKRCPIPRVSTRTNVLKRLCVCACYKVDSKRHLNRSVSVCVCVCVCVCVHRECTELRCRVAYLPCVAPLYIASLLPTIIRTWPFTATLASKAGGAGSQAVGMFNHFTRRALQQPAEHLT